MTIGSSRLWFNEVYSPRIDIPRIRDLGFIVADGAGFGVEVKRKADYTRPRRAAADHRASPSAHLDRD